MTLSEKQQLFTQRVGLLIAWAVQQGYGLTFGDAYRSPEEASRLAQAGKGIARSLHSVRLAVDFNLFIRGVYQVESAAYAPLGAFWKSLSTLDAECCWGGDFSKQDGNHFSIAHEGRK